MSSSRFTAETPTPHDDSGDAPPARERALAYQSYRRLPSLAGLASMADAVRPGLTVDECVRRIKRFHYAFLRLSQVFTARITAEPIYELKMGFSLHAHLCAEQVTALAGRVAELREPPLGLDVVPDPALELFFDEILASPTTEELVMGLYGRAIPALRSALERYCAETHPVADHPTARLCRFALLDLEAIATFGAQAITSLIDETLQQGMADWLALLDAALVACGGLDGATPPPESAASDPLARRYSAQPFVYQGTPRRDERFPDPYNMGVNAEAFLYNPAYPPDAKVVMMYYKRLREIDVPEMLASILTETMGKPWAYYRDLTRQLWDEARHALMGELGFVSLGVDWRQVMINFTWSLALNTQLTPLERHGVLYFIEQGLMPKTGKRYEWEVAVASHNALAARMQDFDWADEVLHAHIGRAWYVSAFPTTQEAKQFGDAAWSRALLDWARWRDEGLTQHRNWWPQVYQEACEQAGEPPDPAALAFHETYESARADRKAIAVSE